MEKSENTQNRFWKYIRSLIEPPPNITDIRQRHQARLLSALLLFIIVLGGFSGTIQFLTVPGFFPTFIAILAGVIVLCFAYFLAHTKNYLFAATLTALTPLIASYAALLENTEDQSAFTFMLISVLLSSMLLNRWLTLGVAFLNLLGLVLLPVIQPAWTIEIMSGKVSFHIMISALILIAMWQRDLIERDRQRELSESELKFRSIFDHSVDAIGVSMNGIHIMANPAYVRMFGYKSPDNLMGRSIMDLIAPSERARIQENIRRRSIGEDVPAIYETRGLRCDATEFDMEVHVSTYKLDGKLYTVPILRDVTERKRAEAALRASEEAYKLLFESNPQPMWVYDTNSLAFLAVNDEAVSRYGYSREEFLGMTIKDIRPKADIPRLMDNIAHLSGGLDHAGNWRHIKKDGSLIDVEITSHFLFFEGKPAELVIANDITEQKRIERERETLILELESKNAELERFTYTVSHDLKSPLVTIKGFLGYIQQDIASGNVERLNSDLERIGNATNKMEKLLRDLLELSRIGRLVKPLEEVPFEDLVLEALEIVHGQLVARGVTVHIQPNLPAIFGDRQRLVEVLQNLLDNAVKYMGDQADPLVEFGLRGREDNEFIFYVRDNGIGIVPQYHEKVFGLFNKLDVHSEGTGVGLALVKRIIEFHGGRIWVESEGKNRGTTICFTLQAPPNTAPGSG